MGSADDGGSSKYAQEVFDYVNAVRENPESFVPHLQKRMAAFVGMNYRVPGTNIAIRTVEGPAGVDETISFLQSTPGLARLQTLSQGLCLSCWDLCADAGPAGLVGNTLSDGTTIEARISRYGQWSGSLTECTAYGPSSPLNAVLQWLIDDGNPSRSHRNSIFSQSYMVAGVANGPHSLYNTMVVMALAGSYYEGTGGAGPATTKPSTTQAPKPVPTAGRPAEPPPESSQQLAHQPAEFEAEPPGQGGDTGKFDTISNATTTFDSGFIDSLPQDVDPPLLQPKHPAPTVEKRDLKPSALYVDGSRARVAIVLHGPPILEELKLTLRGRRLLLSVISEDRGNNWLTDHVWELPHAPAPQQVTAVYGGATLKISVNLAGTGTAAPFKLPAFKLPGTPSGKKRVQVDTQQQWDHVAFRLVPSVHDCNVYCEFTGNQVVVTTRHVETEKGEEIEVEYRRPVSLPFPLHRSLVKPAGSAGFKVLYPGARDDSASFTIPISST
eukprot:CAMPEP_0119146338 /NCGR_PEP_ID=MMETSP1310-20130426/38751_1 /TAXON_ID=464262 /ORGANISM="Genus nov. species nov., Strain RCC2339" /LENGTH=496 /DNA_ID=CAMNT_0007138217 /DNA_START=50 /DNA_END=1540 /DNA_ORIENTATION=+